MRFPNGYGGIVRLGGNRRKPFQVRITTGYTDTGKQQYQTLGYFAKKEDAINCLAEYNQKPYDVKAKEITFDQLYKSWKKEHFDKITVSTRNCYITAKKYCGSIDNLKFAEIRTIHLQKVIDSCSSYAIRKNIRILFNQMYKFAEKLDISNNKRYSKYIDIGKAVKVHEKKPFTEEEIQIMFKKVKEIPFLDIALIINFSGLRVMELLEVKRENVFLEDRYMIGGKKTEAGTDRVIPISKKILPFIEKYYNQGNEYLITMDGKPIPYYTYMRHIWNPAMEKLGFDHTPHERKALLCNCII